MKIFSIKINFFKDYFDMVAQRMNLLQECLLQESNRKNGEQHIC